MNDEKKKIVFRSLPVDGPLRITSSFGPRNTGISGASTYHKGVDLGRDLSKPETGILAVAAGTITKSYWNDYRGWVTVIDHDGFQTLSQHLKNKGLPEGTRVSPGQKIGIMGASSDPAKLKVAVHLHFELLVNGIPVDPVPYLMKVEKEEVDLTEAEVRKIVRDETAAELNRLGVPQEGLDVPSDWAKSFWKWGSENGITDGSRPKGLCTREQVVTMMNKFLQLVKK